jgi:anion-transporting  ArsA/GET3 family ATPase
MCNAKERLSYLLEVAPIGPQIRTILPSVDAVNMEPGAALEEYGTIVLRVRALSKLIFENRLVSAFLHGTPGMDAWAMLGKAQYHAFELGADGRQRYDTVIVDAPATGHGLELLRVPKVIMDLVPPGLLRRDAERAWQLFTDEKRSGVLIASTPEELPANESIELYQTLRSELQLPVCGVAVNMVLPTLFDAPQTHALEQLRARADLDAELGPLVQASRSRALREQIQAEQIARLQREIAAPSYTLPMLFAPDLRRAEVETLSRAFD